MRIGLHVIRIVFAFKPQIVNTIERKREIEGEKERECEWERKRKRETRYDLSCSDKLAWSKTAQHQLQIRERKRERETIIKRSNLLQRNVIHWVVANYNFASHHLLDWFFLILKKKRS